MGDVRFEFGADLEIVFGGGMLPDIPFIRAPSSGVCKPVPFW